MFVKLGADAPARPRFTLASVRSPRVLDWRTVSFGRRYSAVDQTNRDGFGRQDHSQRWYSAMDGTVCRTTLVDVKEESSSGIQNRLALKHAECARCERKVSLRLSINWVEARPSTRERVVGLMKLDSI